MKIVNYLGLGNSCLLRFNIILDCQGHYTVCVLICLNQYADVLLDLLVYSDNLGFLFIYFLDETVVLLIEVICVHICLLALLPIPVKGHYFFSG